MFSFNLTLFGSLVFGHHLKNAVFLIREHFLKVPMCEIFDPIFFLHHVWVGDLRTGIFLFFLKTTADISHFVFFAHVEYALKNYLRMLSMR